MLCEECEKKEAEVQCGGCMLLLCAECRKLHDADDWHKEIGFPISGLPTEEVDDD